MSDFKSFIVNNGVLSTTAGITIGFATASFVKSLVADVILPVIFMVLVKGSSVVSKGAGGFFGKFLANKEFLFANFVSEMITWILIVLFAFLVLEAIYKHYIQSKPFITQEQLAKPFQVTQELIQKYNPFAHTESFVAPAPAPAPAPTPAPEPAAQKHNVGSSTAAPWP